MNRKPTPENIRLLADTKGISEEMAKKYFEATCEACGKKCNETEIAMFYKTFGRFESAKDTRKPLCQKCYCKKVGIDPHEFFKRAHEFVEEGCPLF